MDFFPTLASLCGLPAPDIVNGMDLSGHTLGRGGRQREGALMMNYVSHWDFPETGTEWPEWRAVRTKQFNYVRWLNGAEELYDNAPDVMERMRRQLRDLLNAARDEFLPGTAYARGSRRGGIW